jgi:hypothetical protein
VARRGKEAVRSSVAGSGLESSGIRWDGVERNGGGEEEEREKARNKVEIVTIKKVSLRRAHGPPWPGGRAFAFFAYQPGFGAKVFSNT